MFKQGAAIVPSAYTLAYEFSFKLCDIYGIYVGGHWHTRTARWAPLFSRFSEALCDFGPDSCIPGSLLAKPGPGRTTAVWAQSTSAAKTHAAFAGAAQTPPTQRVFRCHTHPRLQPRPPLVRHLVVI